MLPSYSLGWAELRWKSLVKALLAELFGTMMLVIIGCGAAINFKTEFDITQVSLAFGLAVTAIASITGHISGGHLNPAVSVGLLLGGELPLLNCLGYILSQCVGAILGAGLLHAFTPEAHEAGLGANGLGEVAPFAGFLLEALLSMMLVLVVFSTAVDPGKNTAPGLAPLLIGLTVTAAHLVCIPFTGTSINPARSLGPAIVKGLWADHWVFWVGPLLGGATGGFLYSTLLRSEYKASAGRDLDGKV